jgi:acetyl-CoA carboxylase biotin carboxyl carrier protein
MSGEHDDPVDHQPSHEADTSGPDLVEPVAVGPGDPAARPTRPQPRDGAANPADASLLALIDRLAAVLEKSELGELEVGVGGTTIILRSPAAIERTAMGTAMAPETIVAEPAPAPGTGVPATAAAQAVAAAAAAGGPARPSVKAPLTGIYYGAPSPGAMPYVAVGDHVSVGQIIGLIEAMKLFNEIKSDIAGRVARICADNGQLVKARQPLIEVDRA